MSLLNSRCCLLLLVFVIASSAIGCGNGNDRPLNSKVIMIGDSYFAMDGRVPGELEELSGQSYRHYFVNGAKLGGTSPDSVINQYAQARAEDPDIRTVLMVGGGNDVLSDPNNYCRDRADPPNSNCRELVGSIASLAENLLYEMHSDGVKNVVLLLYPHLADFGSLDYTIYNSTIDYAYTRFEDIVDPGLDHYCIVDPRSAFEGHDEYFVRFDIHPGPQGARVIAGLIWNEMKANGIEQGD